MLPFQFIYAVLVSSMFAGSQHGYSAAVLNAPEEFVKTWTGEQLPDLKKDTIEYIFYPWIVSVFTVGGIVGGLISGFVAQSLGRKGGLMLNDVLIMISGALMTVCKMAGSPYVLLSGRLLIGVCCGLNAGLCPMYLTEISPHKYRGAVGSMYQLFITTSIMFAYLISLKQLMGTETLWPYLFIFHCLTGFLQMVGFLFTCESPKYFLDKGKEEKAQKAMQKLYGKNADTSEEMGKMKADAAATENMPKLTLKEFFTKKIYVKPLIFGISLNLAQQFSGINAIIFYSTDIFKQAGIGEYAQICTFAIGGVNVAMTIVSIFLIEYMGRKPLLIWGFFGMAISSLVTMICLYFVSEDRIWATWLVFAMVLFFIICFASGAGSIPWIIGCELFLTHARPMAISFIVPFNWIGNLIVGLAFKYLKEVMHGWVFGIFLGFEILTIFLVWIFIPETKNRPVEEIVAEFV